MSQHVEEYPGGRITIQVRGGRCIHSRNCVLGLPGVFEANAPGAWVHPEAASPEAIAEIAHSCPSGAIAYRRTDGGADEHPPAVNVIRLRENGPLAVLAELDVAGDRSSLRATLCRCGASRNKPYCDNSHIAAGFVASGESRARDSSPLDHRNGPLTVTPQPNGPLHVSGAVEICAGTGHTIERTQDAWLCRCGASADKPYCDGSHKRVGFVAP